MCNESSKDECRTRDETIMPILWRLNWGLWVEAGRAYVLPKSECIGGIVMPTEFHPMPECFIPWPPINSTFRPSKCVNTFLQLNSFNCCSSILWFRFGLLFWLFSRFFVYFIVAQVLLSSTFFGFRVIVHWVLSHVLKPLCSMMMLLRRNGHK